MCFRLCWRLSEIWWTPSVLSLTGCMTSSSATVTRAVPTTPKCPTRSRLWTSTTPSCHWTTCVYVSQITTLKSQKKTLNCRCPLSGETQNMLCYCVITHMHYLYLIHYILPGSLFQPLKKRRKERRERLMMKEIQPKAKRRLWLLSLMSPPTVGPIPTTSPNGG